MKKRLFFTLTVLTILISSCKLPIASFVFSPDSVQVGDTVFFQSTSQNAISYDWDFGDGSGSSLENPSHIYQAAGEFSVVLAVSNSGGYDKARETISVSQ